MAPENPRDRTHIRRPPGHGFLRKPGDFFERNLPRVPTPRPLTYHYGWHTSPSSPELLCDLGLDPRDHLAGSVNPLRASLLNTGSRKVLELSHTNDTYPGRRSPPNALRPATLQLTKATQRELLRRLTTPDILRPKTGGGAEYSQAGDGKSETTSATFTLRQPLVPQSNQARPIRSAEQRRNLFSPVRDTHRPRDFAAVIKGAQSSLRSHSPFCLTKDLAPATSEAERTPRRSTLDSPILNPGQTTAIYVSDTTGTSSIFLPQNGLRRVSVQNCSSIFGANGCTSRKRHAEESEVDLIVANATNTEAKPGTVSNLHGIATLDWNKQGSAESEVRARSSAWLVNIMTSVRGAVNKVSNSIAGYVYPRNYNVVEQQSRDQATGNISTKRIKLEPDTGSHNSTHRQELGTTNSKSNLVWIDESTRLANWHQINRLVRALQDISRRVQRGQAGNRVGSSSPSRIDDESRSRRLCLLSAHLRSIQQTATILEHIYSHTFLANLKDMYRSPTPTMDYATNPDEYLAIAAAKLFLDDLPSECASPLIEAGVPPRIIKGASADLDAIVNQKPMPGLVQKSGFVGKVMKFLRGPESFGLEASRDLAPQIDRGMPGSFPDTETKNESAPEETNGTSTKPERRLDHKRSASFSPVTQTDTYDYIREHLAEMETKGMAPLKDISSERRLEGHRPKVAPSPILARDRQRFIALKRLQRSRGIKKVHFSTSTKAASPSPTKATNFIFKMFGSRSEPANNTPPCKLEVSLSDAQADGSAETRASQQVCQEIDKRPHTGSISEDSDEEAAMGKCKPRLVRHLNESLKELNAKVTPNAQDDSFGSKGLPSPPTLVPLKISDDKEGELDDLSATFQLMFDLDEAEKKADEARKAKAAEEEKLRKTGGLRVPRRRLVTSLSTSWIQRVRDTLRANPHQALAITAESVELRQHDFSKVVPKTEWLNDEIVNGSLLWLDRYVNAAAGVTDVRSPNRVCLTLGSFFYKRLEDVGVANTERTLRRSGVTKANFLNLQTILMPICKGNHWTLLVVRPQKRTVSHMDSLNPRGSPAHTRRALDWIEAILGDDFKKVEWKTVRHDAPAQDNGYDCGVHTITNGMCVALGINPIDAYDSDELPLQRLRIAGMLLNKGFSGDFDLAGL